MGSCLHPLLYFLSKKSDLLLLVILCAGIQRCKPVLHSHSNSATLQGHPLQPQSSASLPGQRRNGLGMRLSSAWVYYSCHTAGSPTPVFSHTPSSPAHNEMKELKQMLRVSRTLRTAYSRAPKGYSPESDAIVKPIGRAWGS